MNLYEATLGERNRIYYLTKFEQYDQKRSGLRASWNWSAFFFSYFWALYRKMYGWFFAYMGIVVLAVVLDASGYLDFTRVPGLAIISTIPMWIVFSVYANSLYHISVKKKIDNAQANLKDEPKLLEYLRHKGGVHKWVMWASIPFIMFPIILVIVSIPLLDR
jgi:hypothetical protein